jgi:hypothetical protein
MGGGGGAGSDEFFVPHTGSEGWRGLLENKRALGLATFASLGGVLYGYNQGVFGQVQVMHNFTTNYNDTVSRCFSLPLLVHPPLFTLSHSPNSILTQIGDPLIKGMLTSILELGA